MTNNVAAPINNDNIDNSAQPEFTQEQLLALYQYAFSTLLKENKELKETIRIKDMAMNSIYDIHASRLAEVIKEHDETKEKFYQVVKKDEMKTALLKQLIMQKK